MSLTRPGSQTTEPTTTHQSDLAVDSCSGLEQLATTAPQGLDRVILHLSAARCRIIVAAADPLTHWLNDASVPPSSLREQVQKGLAQLDLAEGVLTDIEADDKSINTTNVRRRADLLKTFGLAFLALTDGTDSQESRDRLIDHCADLAIYVDDDDKMITESAKLWQAVAYRRAGKPDRALQILRPVLSPPASPRIGLYARLERCRALADKGDFVSAISLASRLAVRVESWFDTENEATQRAAVGLVKGVRVDLYRTWTKKLQSDGQAYRAKQADGEAEKLAGDAKPADMLVLTESVAGVPTRVSAEPGSQPDEFDSEEESETP
ncbi:MAG: hypothetical protein AABZ08_11550 [Planctomycetota bacterium]